MSIIAKAIKKILALYNWIGLYSPCGAVIYPILTILCSYSVSLYNNSIHKKNITPSKKNI